MPTRILHGIKIFEQLKWDHQRLIPVKFGEIAPSAYGNLVYSILLDDEGRQMLDKKFNNRHPI